ncbi:hypothetical protein AM500_21540 [Bacillus sp. FJAT-18017]|uniref:hypothetical protein n=1 Tax=Bacillus sp. FJAT-18017 TaxID=1705566 RepID=UPI0006B03FF7|nr:hypothetical protein [Bacillus sp. FJAT-18017]ALC92085.1 hypothetical protein AM500_21540 [Bacillus sp. FJAT-18017]
MSAISVVRKHTYDSRGHADMTSKTHIIGNTTVIIHSPLVSMTSLERKLWFEEEMKKGNPALERISQAVLNCYKPNN